MARSGHDQGFPPNNNASISASVVVGHLPSPRASIGGEGTQGDVVVAPAGNSSPSPSTSPTDLATSRQASLPTYNFNRERYPAYDIHARRVGLQQTLMGKDLEPGQRGSHYRLRTHFYPAPNSSLSDYPHGSSLDSHVALSDTPSGSNEATTMAESTVAPPSPSPAPEASVDPEPRSAPASVEQTSSYTDNHRTDEPRATTPEIRRILHMEADEEVGLQALVDPPPGERPIYSYPTLIMLAIHDSKKKQLTLQQIYEVLETRFQWYKDHPEDKSWQVCSTALLDLQLCADLPHIRPRMNLRTLFGITCHSTSASAASDAILPIPERAVTGLLISLKGRVANVHTAGTKSLRRRSCESLPNRPH